MKKYFVFLALVFASLSLMVSGCGKVAQETSTESVSTSTQIETQTASQNNDLEIKVKLPKLLEMKGESYSDLAYGYLYYDIYDYDEVNQTLKKVSSGSMGSGVFKNGNPIVLKDIIGMNETETHSLFVAGLYLDVRPTVTGIPSTFKLQPRDSNSMEKAEAEIEAKFGIPANSFDLYDELGFDNVNLGEWPNYTHPDPEKIDCFVVFDAKAPLSFDSKWHFEKNIPNPF